MATKYRVYNELSEDEKAQIATEKQWHKRGYCPVENEGELMYCNRSWSKAVYFRADQVRREVPKTRQSVQRKGRLHWLNKKHSVNGKI